jgi:microcystin-dependent protein
MFAGNFAPRGWAFCDGQLLAISSNSALFSILGTTYGGDGRVTFGLPDLRGRAPIHAGGSQGPGLSRRRLGEKGGSENVTLAVQQLPPHNHKLKADEAVANQVTPEGNVLASKNRTKLYSDGPANKDMGASSIGNAGGGQAHPNMQPYLGINYIICLQGIYPSRP